MVGKKRGMQTLLVLSGATSPEEAWNCPVGHDSRPDFVATSLAALLLGNMGRESDGGYEGDLSSGDMTGDEGKKRRSGSRSAANKRRRRMR